MRALDAAVSAVSEPENKADKSRRMKIATTNVRISAVMALDRMS